MREISSHTSRMFDPLGLMTPLLLEGKLILQSLWRLKLGWDEQVPEDVCSQYNRWLKRAGGSHLSHIARRVKPPFRSQEERLVIFTDASSSAQAAVAYLFCSNESQSAGRIWAAKQKLSSVNRSESISRLELEGAVIGITLARQICRSMQWDLNSVLYFTDSTTVLWWLRTCKELDVFVGNRVCKILDHSSRHQWFHVCTKDNPADIPTRGLSGRLLAESSLWWTGPVFFRRPREQWPKQPEVVETRSAWEGYRKEEKRRVEGWLCASQQHKDVDQEQDAFWLQALGRFGDLRLGLRACRRALEFLGKFSRCGWEVYKDTERAIQIRVFRGSQAGGLREFIEALETGKPVSKKFKAYDPFLDRHGVVRLGGRLRHVTRLPFETRCPVILAGDHEYALQLLRHIHVHELNHCGGKKTLMAETRWKVWITGLSKMAKRVIKECTRCTKSCNTKALTQKIAPMHYTRIPIKDGHAFSEIGLDMAGPFIVKHGRTRAVGKRFILLFSCCWTRALSLEMVEDASTDSCVMAFLRHSNTYGFPKYVNSDRGTNLVGADRHFKEQWATVEKELAAKSIDWPTLHWNFNPPYSPRFSGHVEIMVKITKTSLRRILGQPKYLFRDEELRTLIKIVQGYANMRPLSEPSTDPLDAPPLVPADFLLTGNRFLGGIPEVELDKYPLRTRKEMMGKVTKELWKELTSEYLLELQKSGNWKSKRALKPGEVVLMLDKTWPSGRYRLGRIESTIEGPDGVARAFRVRHGDEVVKRSLMTLAPLHPETL